MKNKTEHLQQIFILHRHWIWGNSMRINFYQKLEQCNVEKIDVEFFLGDLGMYLSYWYGTLYSIIERYRELKMQHKGVDFLLSDGQKLQLLRLFRNAIFHVQNEYIHSKTFNFIDAIDSAEWVSKVHEAMGNYLLNELK